MALQDKRVLVIGGAFPEGYRERLTAMAQKQLVPRPGQPDEAAEVYLTCMRSSFLTG